MFEIEKIRSLQIAVLCLVAALSGSAVTYALMVLWSTPVQLTVEESLQLGVFWDSACTNPVTTIDFGNQKVGAYAYKEVYIKNTGNSKVTLDWTSNAPSTLLAGDDWVYSTGTSWANIRGYVLGTGEVLKARYEIFILPNASPSAVSWTLQLGR